MTSMHIIHCRKLLVLLLLFIIISEGKLKPRAKKDAFVGFGSGVEGYRIWSPFESRVILSRGVIKY